MKRVALLLALLLVPLAAQAFDTDKPETIRIAVLRSNDSIPAHLRDELRRAGFDAFTIDLTLDEIEARLDREVDSHVRDADFYVEVLTADRFADDYHGGAGIYAGRVGVDIGVVWTRIDARVQVYEAETLDLIARFDVGEGKTRIAPTGVSIGGRRGYGWVAIPLGWMQNRSAARAVAKSAAVKVADAVLEP